MPSTTTLAITALSLLAKGALALPVSQTADLQVFADAFLKTTTGGAFSTCDSLSGVVALTGSARASAFNTWAYGYCFNTYHDAQACTEISAFLAATVYAYTSGWAGVDLFASLGGERVGRWHSLLSTVCSKQQCPSGACSPIWTKWDIFASASTSANIDVNAHATQTFALNALGYLNFIDHPGTLTSGLGLVNGLGTKVTGNVIGKVGGALHTREIAALSNSFAGGSGNVKFGAGGLDAHGEGSAGTFDHLQVGHLTGATLAGYTSGSGDLHVDAHRRDVIAAAGAAGHLDANANAILQAGTNQVNGVLAGTSSTAGKIVATGGGVVANAKALVDSEAGKVVAGTTGLVGNLKSGVNGVVAGAQGDVAALEHVAVDGISASAYGSLHNNAHIQLDRGLPLLSGPLEVVSHGDADLLSVTKLQNGALTSSTLGKATGLLGVLGRDVDASAE